MIWTDSPCWITCWNDSNTYVQALQKPSIECIVAMHPWLENDCLMADIILPGATRFEMMDIGNDLGGGAFVSVFLEDHCVDPVGESRCNFDIVTTIAEKLGLKEEYTLGKTHEEKQKLVFEGSGRRPIDILGRASEEEVLRHPLRPEVKDVPPGLRAFWKTPGRTPSPPPRVFSSIPHPPLRSTSPMIPSALPCLRGSRKARATTSA